MLKKIALMLVACGVLTACNTFEGLGRDIKKGGEAMTDVAKEAKDSMKSQ